jgi:hypothetical protein
MNIYIRMSTNMLDEHRTRPCALQMDVAFSPEMLVVTYLTTRCANTEEHTEQVAIYNAFLHLR